MPPRHTKSSIVSVAFPTWIWITSPGERFLCASYAMSLAIRDSQRCRDLIDSDWYQEKFGSSFQWLPDQNQKARYENNVHGFRIATSVEGAATGEGGSYILCDDPHNIQEGESDSVRQGTLEWWDRVMSSRLNDQLTGRMVVIGQRVHEQDLIGHLLEAGGWEYLCLPAEYETDKKTVTSIGWSDPRTEQGEPLWPDKFPKSILEYLKKTLLMHYYAQYQQRPTSEAGSILKSSMFMHFSENEASYILHDSFGSHIVPKSQCRTVISTDLAVSKNQEADFTVILTWAVTPDLKFLLLDIVHEHLEAPESEALIFSLASSAKRLWAVLIEDVAFQKSVIQRLRKGTPMQGKGIKRSLPIMPYKPLVDKVARAQSMAVYFVSENFFFNPNIANYADYKKELTGFPRTGHDDYVDATTIIQALFVFGEPRITTMEDYIAMTEAEAIREIAQENKELAEFLQSDEDEVTLASSEHVQPTVLISWLRE